MSKTAKITLLTFLAFGVHFIFDDIYFKDIRRALHGVMQQVGLSHMVAYVIVGIPLFAAALYLNGRSGFFSGLGLNKSIGKGFAFAAICTLPMFVGFSFFFEFNTNVKLNTILISILAAAFFEELYFRGFLFGQLYRHTSLGFMASVLLGALLFGFIHLYQSNDPMELVGIFLITFLGAMLFAWAYAEWDQNLWVPVWLHLLMNLAWELFDISDNALGGLYSNVFRFTTIGLIIGLTVLYKRRKGIPLAVSWRGFLLKKPQRESVLEVAA